MTILVHITGSGNARSIRRLGLRPGRNGLFALPATEDYMATHQWSRELKRFGAKVPIAVYFRVPASTRVQCGYYHGDHHSVAIGEAIQQYQSLPDPRGFEIILDVSVPRRDIVAIRWLRRPVGWRFAPEAKGRVPLPWHGEYSAARIRRRLNRSNR